MSRILIAGCGDIGTSLGSRLAEAGHQVWGLRRGARVLPEPIRPLSADVTEPSSLSDLPDGLDAVFYTVTPGGRDRAAYERAYVLGFANLLAALESAPSPPGRLFYVSSTSVYGQDDGSWVDEDSKTQPTTFSGRAVLAGERLAGASRIDAVVVRFAGIYGPRRTRLLEQVRGGATYAEGPPQFTNRIHRDDCVAVLAHLLAVSDPAGCYLGVDDAPVPQCEVVEWLAEQLSAPAPRRVSADRLSRRAGSKRCSNARLRASGFVFSYPTYKAGYRALLAD